MSQAQSDEPRPPRRRLSFRLALLVAVLPQIALAIAMTGWLSYRSARQSIEDVAVHLREETNQRIQDTLTELFELAPIITQLNQENIRVGLSDVWDFDQLALTFWKQMQAFDRLEWVTFGRTDGGYLSLQRVGGVMEIERKIDGVNRTYALNDDGTLGDLLRTLEDYDPRERGWYTEAIAAGELVWAGPYKWINLDVLCLDAVVPVYDADENELGVLDAGFSLTGISDYLGGVRVGGSGRTFIMERDGDLVAASAGPVLAPGADGVVGRVAVADAEDRVIREAAAALEAVSPGLALDSALAFEFPYDDHRVFVQATPLNPDIGLDWLVVVAIPDDELMAHIDANVRNTFLASLAALVIAFLVSLLLTRWIARPLIDLAARARRIQHGDLEVRFVSRSRDEIGVLTDTLGDMVAGLKDRERLRDAFGRYVSEEVAEGLLSDPDSLAPGGVLQPVTILMSDLRGFSVLTAKLGPSEMVALLNAYLSCMVDVVRGYQGFVNDFIGDAILIVFGVPKVGVDDTDRALRCALAMQMALDAFNRENHERLGLELEMGIGVDVGEVIVGNIGGEHRVKYGVIGDAVNMAARIESLTLGGQILISQAARDEVGDAFETGQPITVKVKGREAALTVYELVSAREDPSLRVRLLDETALREIDTAADLYVLSGKSIPDRPSRVAITRLGERALELVHHDEPLEPLQNIKLRMRDRGDWPSGWYAKVRSVADESNGSQTQRCLIAFTHEAEQTLEERLRDRLAGAAESPDAASSGPRAAFLQQLVEAPIESPADREVATRILVEMAAADGVLKAAEREFVARFIGDSSTTIEALMGRDPLCYDELRAVGPGPVRETMLMLAWATALCDAELADEEVGRLAELAVGLEIDEERALELSGVAQLYLADAAFAIVWPPDRSAGEDPDEDALSDAYTTLIEGWVPQYGELLWATVHHVPPELTPKRILDLGCGDGSLGKRLRERFPDAELHLVDASETLAERCRRRFPDDNVIVQSKALQDLDFPPEHFDLVASCVALHPLAETDKRALFDRIHTWLTPGGCFSYSDIFLGATEAIQEQHLAEWRRAAFALGTTEADWDAFMARRDTWGRSTRLNAQLEWLTQSGFQVVDCTWKHSMWTNILALNAGVA